MNDRIDPRDFKNDTGKVGAASVEDLEANNN
jgi:hypothetical protein